MLITILIIAISVLVICILVCVITRLVKRVKERRLNNVEIEVIPVEKVENAKDIELAQSGQKLVVEDLDDYVEPRKRLSGLPFTGQTGHAPIEIVTGDYNSNISVRHLLEPGSNVTVLRDSIEVSSASAVDTRPATASVLQFRQLDYNEPTSRGGGTGGPESELVSNSSARQ